MQCRGAFLLSLVFGLCTGGLAVYGQDAGETPPSEGQETRRFLIDYDSSNSMWGELSDKSRKYEAGRNALEALLEDDFSDREIAFRAYGHRRKNDCRDSELVVPFTDLKTARERVKAAAAELRPTGKTPITYSLREALKDFDGRQGDILLISDGIETCDMDPCALMREWRESKVGIRVHVVGVGLTEFERQAMACIAETSGGTYFDADSAEGFAEAVNDAGDAIDTPPPTPEIVQPGDPDPVDQVLKYAFNVTATDDQGRFYIATGKLFKDGVEVGTVTSNGRNVLQGPGDYEIEIGAVLADKSTYEPVRQAFTVDGPGEETVAVTVARPAVVSASFMENGEEHPGSFVTAYQDGKEVFGFRAFDDALVRPGTYEFRAEPNADNKLFLTETLIEGEQTNLTFDLTKTIKTYIRFVYPDGKILKRSSELWRDGERVYKVFSNNATTVRPGVYELRSDDQNVPLTPVEIEIKTDGDTIKVPLDAGWVTISYAPSDFDYAGTPDRAFLESLDRGGSKYASLNMPIPAKPGRYRVNPQDGKGFMDPIEVEVLSNETVAAVITPKPLGEVLVSYVPSSRYTKEPDRASIEALDGQPKLGGLLRVGVAKKFLPGRYRVKGGGRAPASDALAQEIVVIAGETTNVVLQLPEE